MGKLGQLGAAALTFLPLVTSSGCAGCSDKEAKTADQLAIEEQQERLDAKKKVADASAAVAKAEKARNAAIKEAEEKGVKTSASPDSTSAVPLLEDSPDLRAIKAKVMQRALKTLEENTEGDLRMVPENAAWLADHPDATLSSPPADMTWMSESDRKQETTMRIPKNKVEEVKRVINTGQ